MSYENYTQGAIKALTEAQNKALTSNNQEIKQEHLFWGLLADNDSLVCSLLEKMGKDCKTLRANLQKLINKTRLQSNYEVAIRIIEIQDFPSHFFLKY